MRHTLIYKLDSRRLPTMRLTLPKAEIQACLPAPHVFETGDIEKPFHFTNALRALTIDIAAKVPDLAHLDPNYILFTGTVTRSGAAEGVQARMIPLRFHDGSKQVVKRSQLMRTQEFHVDDVEMKYIVDFLLPRVWDRTYEYKLTTIIHELFHISDRFDGSVRQFEIGGPHMGNHKKFDEEVNRLTKYYLDHGANHHLHHFMRLTFAQLCKRHGSVEFLKLPRPRIIPVKTA